MIRFDCNTKPLSPAQEIDSLLRCWLNDVERYNRYQQPVFANIAHWDAAWLAQLLDQLDEHMIAACPICDSDLMPLYTVDGSPCYAECENKHTVIEQLESFIDQSVT